MSDCIDNEQTNLDKLKQAVCEFGAVDNAFNLNDGVRIEMRLHLRHHALVLEVQKRYGEFHLVLKRQNDEHDNEFGDTLYHENLGTSFEDVALEQVEKLLLRIEQGAFEPEKNTVDKIKALIKQEKLESYMSRSKWYKLRESMKHNLPFPPDFVFFEYINEGGDSFTRHRLVEYAKHIPEHIGDWDEPFCEINVEYLCINPYISKNVPILNKQSVFTKVKSWFFNHKQPKNSKYRDISEDIQRQLKRLGFEYEVIEHIIVLHCLEETED